jgi:hypothetical protein
MSKKKGAEVWKAWEPYLTHLPSHPMGSIQVMEATIIILTTQYKWGPAALEAAKVIRDYAKASLTIAAFAENTNITLEEDPAQVSP